MKIKAIDLFPLFFMFFVVTCSSQKIITKPFPNNPVSYIFKVKIEEASFLLEKNCRKYNNSKFNVYDFFYQKGRLKRLYWPEAVKNALNGDENKYDCYLCVSVDSSDIYFNRRRKPFGYKMECVAHFIAIDNSTVKMEIKVLSAKVHVRDKVLPSFPHFGRDAVYKNVKPTTIEEYEILQSLGMSLGILNQMPALKL